jgi:hypothetical protein
MHPRSNIGIEPGTKVRVSRIPGRPLIKPRIRPTTGLINRTVEAGVPMGGLGDIPHEFLNYAKIASAKKLRAKSNAIFDRPLSTAVSKVQQPDSECYPLGDMVQNTVIAVSAIKTVLLSIKIPLGVRGVLQRFGWTVNAPGITQLTFGLYLNEELVMPGGKYIGSSPRAVNDYNPCGSSLDPNKLEKAPIPLPPGATISIRVSNPSAVNTFLASGRLWGWHWEDQARESGKRVYFNTEEGEVAG